MAWLKLFVKFGKHDFNRFVYVTGPSDEVEKLNGKIAVLVNALKIDQAEILRRALLLGVDELAAGVDPTKLSGRDAMAFEALTLLDKDAAVKAESLLLSKLRATLPPDEFETFCVKHGVSPQDVPKTPPVEQDSWRSRALDWLDRYVSDGEPHWHRDVLEAAETAGIVTNDAEEARLRTEASKRGYSSRKGKGWWQLI